MIFTNPSGAPELACDDCGCRWFDRMKACCYECGAKVSLQAQEEFRRAVQAHGEARRAAEGAAGPATGAARTGA